MLQVVFRGCDMNDVFFFPGIGGLDVKISLSKSYNYLQFTHNIRAFPWLVTLELQARKVKTSTPFFMSHDLEWTWTEATILELVVWNTRTISIYKRGPVCLRSKLWYRWWCQTRKTICFFCTNNQFFRNSNTYIIHIFIYLLYIRTYIYISKGYCFYCWWFRTPAPVDMEIIPLFTGFFTSQVVVWDFSHQVGSGSCFFRFGAMGHFFCFCRKIIQWSSYWLPIGSIYHLYTTSILPIGWLYGTYHLLRERSKQLLNYQGFCWLNVTHPYLGCVWFFFRMGSSVGFIAWEIDGSPRHLGDVETVVLKKWLEK